ncbi:RagB/SusD family nutrient uptake outer membrane protein [Prevotella sp. AM42-24]|uniref:RagB/SusD family nutrient uptake outer membrane protein n=1 Tax=Prevotella sp. AM42-24 TaxID=2293125 RepID=UPI000E5358C9|nr:RagB/SusD family nutrient uptake outer membrane protein [Prevotella sp. AM42-24]RGH45399.1 RagB/SusD family nutrient uptake outer membrane protein [Prevotella sp. AM42-24]
MKMNNRYFVALLGSAMLLTTSCSDLDTNPSGSTMSDGQLNEVLAQDQSKLKSEVSGMYANMIECEAITQWYGSARHYDFGYASTMMMMDASGQDEPSQVSGYNWYNKPLRFVDRTANSETTYFIWNQCYKNIKAANDVLKSVDLENLSDVAKSYVGQAYAMRAFEYFTLIQLYQFSYKGHEDAAGVPIVTEKTAEAEANNPRAAVKDVYKQIMDDLNTAIDYLTDSRSAKSEINRQVAYGLRARVNLVMQNWSDAAADAQKAAEGYTPLSKDAAAAPGFNDVSASNWIWGNIVDESNDIVQSGILNFPSMMCSFTGNGYSPTYACRMINSKLWKEIPSTDVRKGWWIDENLNSPIVNPKYVVHQEDEDEDGNVVKYLAVYNQTGDEVADITEPYTNVKFGAYKNQYGNELNACDIPLMRVEEMILIQAEATAMGGNVEEGKRILENFVRTYRDPSYTCNATTAEGVQDAVWFQRRVELWGEGFSFTDLLRLKKPLDRTGANYEVSVRFNLPAESPIFLYLIPEDEENHNEALVGNNNPVVAVPKAQ